MAVITITAANVALGGDGCRIAIVQAGELITPGEPVFKLAADGKYYAAVNTTVAEAAVIGIAITDAAAGGDYFIICKEGPIICGGTVAAGSAYSVGDTDGAIFDSGDAASPDFVTFLGYGISTTVLQVSINATGIAAA